MHNRCGTRGHGTSSDCVWSRNGCAMRPVARAAARRVHFGTEEVRCIRHGMAASGCRARRAEQKAAGRTMVSSLSKRVGIEYSRRGSACSKTSRWLCALPSVLEVRRPGCPPRSHRRLACAERGVVAEVVATRGCRGARRRRWGTIFGHCCASATWRAWELTAAKNCASRLGVMDPRSSPDAMPGRCVSTRLPAGGGGAVQGGELREQRG